MQEGIKMQLYTVCDYQSCSEQNTFIYYPCTGWRIKKRNPTLVLRKSDETNFHSLILGSIFGLIFCLFNFSRTNLPETVILRCRNICINFIITLWSVKEESKSKHFVCKFFTLHVKFMAQFKGKTCKFSWKTRLESKRSTVEFLTSCTAKVLSHIVACQF